MWGGSQPGGAGGSGAAAGAQQQQQAEEEGGEQEEEGEEGSGAVEGGEEESSDEEGSAAGHTAKPRPAPLWLTTPQGEQGSSAIMELGLARTNCFPCRLLRRGAWCLLPMHLNIRCLRGGTKCSFPAANQQPI